MVITLKNNVEETYPHIFPAKKYKKASLIIYMKNEWIYISGTQIHWFERDVK
jgi:hypothetical protein